MRDGSLIPGLSCLRIIVSSKCLQVDLLPDIINIAQANNCCNSIAATAARESVVSGSQRSSGRGPGPQGRTYLISGINARGSRRVGIKKAAGEALSPAFSTRRL